MTLIIPVSWYIIVCDKAKQINCMFQCGILKLLSYIDVKYALKYMAIYGSWNILLFYW